MCDIKIANIKKGEPYDLYIGRENKWLNLPPSKWGNPYILKRESERELLLKNYEDHIRSRPDLIASLPELEGKILGCYCFSSLLNQGKLCHGMVLIKLYKEFVEKNL